MSEIENKMEAKIAAEAAKKAESVIGFYEDSDVSILRAALLKKYKLEVDADNLVSFSDSASPLAGYSTYLLPPIGLSHEPFKLGDKQKLAELLTGLKETICIALLDKNKNKQILFPYRMVNEEHWVTVRVLVIDQSVVQFEVHDSAKKYQEKEIADYLKIFFTDKKLFSEFTSQDHERTKKCSENKKTLMDIFFDNKDKGKIKFFNSGTSKIFPIQLDINNTLKNVYCGGYTARLIVSLTLKPDWEIARGEVWNCNNEDDHSLRIEDAQMVTQYNPSKAGDFGKKFASRELAIAYTKTQDNQEKEAKQLKETDKALSGIEANLSKIGNDVLEQVLNKILALESQLNFDEVRNIKKILIEIYEQNKESFSENNPLSYFFRGSPKKIDRNSELNVDILCVKLWRDFILLLKKKFKKEEPGKEEAPKKEENGVNPIHKKWDATLFNHFLGLMLFSTNKVYSINCRFEEVELVSLKRILSEASKDLLGRGEENGGILLVRKLNDELTIFRMYIEFYKKEERKKSKEKVKKKSKEKEKIKKELQKRFVIEIFSNGFSEDIRTNFKKTKTWEDINLSIKYKDKIEKEKLKILQELMLSDFLKSEDVDGITRLNCYAVNQDDEYLHTLLLHKLFEVFELELRKIKDKESIAELHREYTSRAEHFFIKDASVAKAQQGFSYQEHLVMLLAYLAQRSSFDKEFFLISEAMVPEAWNDIILGWNGQLIFFQQKHRSTYSTSVEKMYSPGELLSADGDASILKYYKAYCSLKKLINDPKHPLNRYQNKLESENIKFIFFTNKNLPLEVEGEKPEIFNLIKRKKKEDAELIKFKKVNHEDIPLVNLEGFSKVLNQHQIYKINSCSASTIGIAKEDQDNLEKFLRSFYLFSAQKNAEELFLYCKTIIKTPLGGFGQAVLADTFEQYIHRWFVFENPESHVIDRAVVADFFENHERYHHNLVKYSCYNYPTKEFEELRQYFDSIKKLSCFQIIKKELKGKSHIIISCQEPLLALTLVQELFSPGERQVLTPYSHGLKQYEVASNLKYVIAMGEDNELSGLIDKIKKKKPHVKLIQVKTTPRQEINSFNLKIKVGEVEFLTKKYPWISIFHKNDNICLTDLLLFAIKKLSGGLSDEDLGKYVPQELSGEKIILPYDKIEIEVKNWINKSSIPIDISWFAEDRNKTLECRIQINLPDHLDKRLIQAPNNPKFVWHDKNGEKQLYYIYAEKPYFQPIELPWKKTFEKLKPIDFESLAEPINNLIDKEKLFEKNHQDCPNVYKIVFFKLDWSYNHENLPADKWSLSADKSMVFYHYYGKSNICTVNLSDFYQSNVATLVEAEAACGKTWFLRYKISPEEVLKKQSIPIFIRIKDMEKIMGLDDPVNRLIEQASLLPHVCRMAKTYPQYFHVLLDGFDELSKDFVSSFENMLTEIILKGYSVTITVRDYQTNKLRSQTSTIILQQRLNKFSDLQIEECFYKTLKSRIPIDQETLKLEVSKLLPALKEQVEVSEWLGIPFHVSLICEWYFYNRKNLGDVVNLSVSEIYNFIIQNRIERSSRRNRGDIYKLLYKIAGIQIFGKKETHNIFPGREYNLKKELSFDLERSGLLRDPFSENPELFHRTFAEFLVAKRFLRKIIRSSCKNNEVNFKLVNMLYQEEYRLVCRFFFGLLEIHRNDLDMPYELTGEQQHEFMDIWLTDINGQKLNNRRSEKPIVWEESTEELVKIGEEALRLTNKDIHSVSELMENLEKGGSIVNLRKSIENLINNGELVLLSLEEFLKKAYNVYKLKNFFNIIGLYISLKNAEKEPIFRIICQKSWYSVCSFFKENEEMFNWWKIDDLISLIVFVKGSDEDEFIKVRGMFLDYFDNLKQLGNKNIFSLNQAIIKELLIFDAFKLDKDNARKYFMLCLSIYQNTNIEEIRNSLHEMIRDISIKFFLREDYPKNEQSLFEKYHKIDEFDIRTIAKTFHQLKEISRYYDWHRNDESYAFKCWSQGGYIDKDFAMPVLECIGPHLNIIHVFYIKLYVQYGGYSSNDKNRLMNVALNHVEKIKGELTLKAIFSSVLLFSSLVDDWKSGCQYPKLSLEIAKRMIQAFEILLKTSEINPEAKLFIRVLFVDFMRYFEMRGYITCSKKKEDLSTLTLISPNGFIQKLDFTHSFEIQAVHREINSLFSTSKDKTDRLQGFFDVWEKVLQKLQPSLRAALSFPILDADSDPDSDSDPIGPMPDNSSSPKSARNEKNSLASSNSPFTPGFDKSKNSSGSLASAYDPTKIQSVGEQPNSSNSNEPQKKKPKFTSSSSS